MSYEPYKNFAEIYDSFVDKAFYEDYYNYIIQTLKKLGIHPETLLELACGTGNLAILFKNAGFNIEGLDISNDMLKIAKHKGLRVFNTDMVNFSLAKEYDLILCVFDSLNYIQKKQDLLSCFKQVNRHLKDNGLFIFDMNSYYKITKVMPKFRTAYHRSTDLDIVWQNSLKKDTWISEMAVFKKLRSNIYQKFCETHIEKAYTLPTVKSLLKKSGLGILSLHSDFKLNTVKNTSKRWFFVCRKQ